MTYNTLKTSVVNEPTNSPIDTKLFALNDLSPSEKQAALEIIEWAKRKEELGSRWNASFIEVLRILKAEENRFSSLDS
jgi:hypothetical protein